MTLINAGKLHSSTNELNIVSGEEYAKVFTGKIVIPGDKIDENFRALEQAEKEREPFRQYLEALKEEFAQYMQIHGCAKDRRNHERNG